jgi:hypothetical protein
MNRLLPDPLHTPPPVAEQEATKSFPAGRTSSIVAAAAPGPLFVIVME